MQGDETYTNSYGQYRCFNPDKTGSIRVTREYYYSVPSTHGKGYKFVQMKVADAKKIGLYVPDSYITPALALKQMNVYGRINNIDFRYNTKYI